MKSDISLLCFMGVSSNQGHRMWADITPAQVARRELRLPTDMTDAEWVGAVVHAAESRIPTVRRVCFQGTATASPGNLMSSQTVVTQAISSGRLSRHMAVVQFLVRRTATP